LLQVKNITFVIILLISTVVFSQKDSVKIKQNDIIISKEELKKENKIERKKKLLEKYNSLSPSKAAFYSAVFPGGGQIYNRKYWKVPIVWGALGTSIYFYLDNNQQYQRYRTAYKKRKEGLQDEFTLDNGVELISDAGLENAQETLRKNRDLSLLTTVGIYVLQILEASVNAHLLRFDDGNVISLSPNVSSPNPFKITDTAIGLKFKYSF